MDRKNIFPKSPYIGIFDSGIGGLTVLSALKKRFPDYNFVYLADTLNLPYGDKPIEELIKILQKHLDFFNSCEMIIIACNTLSSIITRGLIDTTNYPPIINMIDALTEETALLQNKNVGLLATRFTIDSKEYERKLEQLNPTIRLFSQEASKLAPAIENNSPDLEHILKEYLDRFPPQISHLILGCTHYNLMGSLIQDLRPDLTIIPAYDRVLNKLPQTLNVLKESDVFLTTKYSQTLQELSEKIMNHSIEYHSV